jgi:hypothetical protein
VSDYFGWQVDNERPPRNGRAVGGEDLDSPLDAIDRHVCT